MMDGKTILLVVLGALGIAAIVFFFIKLKKTQDEIRDMIARRFAGKKILLRDPHALHVAQESRGYSQKRGNGDLILTAAGWFGGC